MAELMRCHLVVDGGAWFRKWAIMTRAVWRHCRVHVDHMHSVVSGESPWDVKKPERRVYKKTKRR